MVQLFSGGLLRIVRICAAKVLESPFTIQYYLTLELHFSDNVSDKYTKAYIPICHKLQKFENRYTGMRWPSWLVTARYLCISHELTGSSTILKDSLLWVYAFSFTVRGEVLTLLLVPRSDTTNNQDRILSCLELAVSLSDLCIFCAFLHFKLAPDVVQRLFVRKSKVYVQTFNRYVKSARIYVKIM